jgi:hypothetical protein
MRNRDVIGAASETPMRKKDESSEGPDLIYWQTCAPKHNNVQFSSQLQLLAQFHMHLIFGPWDGMG